MCNFVVITQGAACSGSAGKGGLCLLEKSRSVLFMMALLVAHSRFTGTISTTSRL